MNVTDLWYIYCMALLCEQKRRDIHVDGELLLQIKAICQLPIGLMKKNVFRQTECGKFGAQLSNEKVRQK